MKIKVAAAFLLAVGLLQMAGDLVGVAALRGLGAATAASPAPKVFSAVEGLETYSSKFFLECAAPSSQDLPVALTPEAYARLRGPYNRRNVFGAVLAYGPVLASNPATLPVFLAVSRYALCPGSPVLDELRLPLPRSCTVLRVRVVPREGSRTGTLPLVLEPLCR